MKIYISNLAFSIQDTELKNLFTEYGDVLSAKVITDRETGRSRGFGFVEMTNDVTAQKAISELNRKMVDGRAIQVNEASPRKSTNNSSAKRW